MGAKVLSKLFINPKTGGLIHGVKVARKSLGVSHLFLVDDSLIFYNAFFREAKEVKYILEAYCTLLDN